jgi:ABC-type polysaccharide/polyol phosphate export permease
MQDASLIYDSAERKWPIVYEFTELVRYRGLLYQLISRNIKTRYKRSALGIVWTMVHPLMMMVVLTLAFANVWKISVPNFAVYVLSGLLLWNFFSQTTNSAMSELLWGSTLLHRIYIPRGIFAASALGTSLVNLALSLPALLVVMLVTGVKLRPALLFVPVAILLTSAFVMGVGLILSTLVVYFADIYEMFQILLMSWFYLQPIMYPISIIPDSLRWLITINPIYHFLVIFRTPIYDGRLPSAQEIGVALAIGAGTLVAGWLIFTRKADELAYRV